MHTRVPACVRQNVLQLPPAAPAPPGVYLAHSSDVESPRVLDDHCASRIPLLPHAQTHDLTVLLLPPKNAHRADAHGVFLIISWQVKILGQKPRVSPDRHTPGPQSAHCKNPPNHPPDPAAILSNRKTIYCSLNKFAIPLLMFKGSFFRRFRHTRCFQTHRKNASKTILRGVLQFLFSIANPTTASNRTADWSVVFSARRWPSSRRSNRSPFHCAPPCES